ncbi:hypothetical protein EGW08_010448 [Elysia chlorotica]|uniref:RNase H type-1 domain-containing protein n=1 Tax=Elysia chlorotica TaxID=188477 RepID=A0A3S1BEI4_ELYCH|nr:hypothetical protein EGW08_010448 [Elysia chlorotica]
MAVCVRVGIDLGDRLAPNSVKRKFLVSGMADDEQFPHYQEFHVVHDYLVTPSRKMQARLRKRGQRETKITFSKNRTGTGTVPGVYSIKEQSDVEKRTAAMATIEDLYPVEAWTRIYTDGSATNAIQNGGAGIYIQYPNAEKDTISIPTGIHCSNYEAEACAIIEAATHLAEKTPQTNQVVFLTDALSVLQASKNGKLAKLTTALGQLNYLMIVLQWIPSHCKIPGNEKADSLAKQGAEKLQPDRPITFQELKAIVKNKRKPPTAAPDHYHQLDKKAQIHGDLNENDILVSSDQNNSDTVLKICGNQHALLQDSGNLYLTASLKPGWDSLQTFWAAEPNYVENTWNEIVRSCGSKLNNV